MTSHATTAAAVVTPSKDDAFTRLYTRTTTASKNNEWLVHKRAIEERKRKINIAKEKQKKREEEERQLLLRKENKYYNNRTSARHMKTRKANDLSYDIYNDDDDDRRISLLSQQERFEKTRIANAHTQVMNQEMRFTKNLYYVNRTSQRFATTRIPEYSYFNNDNSSNSISSGTMKKRRSTRRKNSGRRLSSNIPKPKNYFRKSSSGSSKKKKKKKKKQQKTRTKEVEVTPQEEEDNNEEFFIPIIVADDDNDNNCKCKDNTLPTLILEETILNIKEEEEYKDLISSTNTTASLFSISSDNMNDDDGEHVDFGTVSSCDENSDVYGNISSFPSDELDDDIDVSGIIEKALSSSSLSLSPNKKWIPPSWMMQLPTKEKLDSVFHRMDENNTGTISMMKLYTAVPMIYPTYAKLTIPYIYATTKEEENNDKNASKKNPVAFRTAYKSCCSTNKNKNIGIITTNDDEKKNYANEYVDQREFSFFIHYLVYYHNLSHYFSTTSDTEVENSIPIITCENFQQAVRDMDFLSFIQEKDLIDDFFDMIDIHDSGSIQLEYICNYLAFHKSFDSMNVITDDDDTMELL